MGTKLSQWNRLSWFRFSRIHNLPGEWLSIFAAHVRWVPVNSVSATKASLDVVLDLCLHQPLSQRTFLLEFRFRFTILWGNGHQALSVEQTFVVQIFQDSQPPRWVVEHLCCPRSLGSRQQCFRDQGLSRRCARPLPPPTPLPTDLLARVPFQVYNIMGKWAPSSLSGTDFRGSDFPGFTTSQVSGWASLLPTFVGFPSTVFPRPRPLSTLCSTFASTNPSPNGPSCSTDAFPRPRCLPRLQTPRTSPRALHEHLFIAIITLVVKDFPSLDFASLLPSVRLIDHFNNYCLGSHNGAKAALLGSC